MHRFIAAATAAIVFVSPAPAEDRTGWYAGFYGGSAVRNAAGSSMDGAFVGYTLDPGGYEHPVEVYNQDVPDWGFDLLNLGLLEPLFPASASGWIQPGRGTLDYAAAPVAGIVAGYALGDGLRIEADLSHASFGSTGGYYGPGEGYVIAGLTDPDTGEWTWSNVVPFSVAGGPVADDELRATTTATTLLANAWYDFGDGSVRPYLGGGIGVALVNSSWLLAESESTQDSAIGAAAQLGAGLRFPLGNTASFDLGYRYRLVVAPAREAALVIPRPGFPNEYIAIGLAETGLVGIHSLQTGLTFAFD